MKLFRQVLFWSHLAAGITAGIVILIMSVTGVLLTYQRQMQYWADTRHYQVAPPPGARRLSATVLLAAGQACDPATPATSLTLRADPAAPAAVALGSRTFYLNPYTAEVLGEPTGLRMRAFFTRMVVWHRYVAMSGESRPTGKAITGASNLLFLFIVVSGIYLWWPRTLTRAQFRNILWFRGGLRPKARDFNWHNVLGFWSALPLALVVYSGVVISYPWASNMVYRVMGEAPPVGGGRGAVAAAQTVPAAGGDLDRVLDAAMTFQPGWTILTARVPAEGAENTTVMVDQGDGGQPHLRGTLTLDATSGEVDDWDGYTTQTPGRRARSFLRFAHTGEAGGLAGQTVAGAVSAAAVLMVYTGLALSLRRFAAFWRRRIVG